MESTSNNGLTDIDLDSLARSYIAPEPARRSGLYRVDSSEGARLVGHEGKRGDYSGIVFPYFMPGNNQPREYRLRRDRPDYKAQADGSLKEERKYLSPPSSRNLAYFVPGTLPEWLEDTNLPLAIVEGEKKAIALFRLAFYETETPRFLPFGFAGVWCWRGVISKKTDEKGARRDVKGVISDFDLISWKG